MSNYEKKTTFIGELIGDLFGLGRSSGSEDMLAEGLDQPNWHLKYARNITYAVLLIGISKVYWSSAAILGGDLATGLLFPLLQPEIILMLGIAALCGIIDSAFGDEEGFGHSFSQFRFWIVVLAAGSTAFYAAAKILAMQ